MRRSRFSEEQIIAILRKKEAGSRTADVCRTHGISPASFCKWKANFDGLEVSDVARLRTLEDENGKLNVKRHRTPHPDHSMGAGQSCFQS